MQFPSKLKARYEIKEELGAGGMGAVYRAYDKVIKSEVALKTLLDISDATALKMFRDECNKLARMVHPNVVEIRDIGEFDSGQGKQPYLVMPLLRGATLDRLIRPPGQRLAIERVVDILCQACRGLQAAHDAGLVHRDLKPSNIFVLEDDSVKLIDFGVAYWSGNGETRGMKGTLLYMSPEQVQVKGVSAMSDIFSLGVVAYQALTGRSPFERRTEEEVVQAILTYTPPPASEYNSDVTLGLSQAVHKAMAKLPSNRYRSAREFGEVLQKAHHQRPIEMFDPARIQPRIETANQALDKGDLELAAEVVGELDAEGHLDPQVTALRRKIEQLSRSKKVLNLLDGARTRLRQQEFPLALQKIQEALEIDKNNADALALKENVEARRAEHSINDWLQLAKQHMDNHVHERARDAIHNVLQLKPNDARAVTLLAEVERRKSEYEKTLREKQSLHQAAQDALNRGEVSSALSKMERVLQLDKQAPDRSSAGGSASYQSLYNEIRNARDEMQVGYNKARDLQAAGEYSKALVFCNENLARHPGHALLEAMKLDLEVSQRQQISAYIADIDRRVDNEPDLDKRLAILKEATEKFPDVEHFQTNYDLVQKRRDLIESIVSRAHILEERGHYGEALSQWETLQSIYDRYPGLEFEFQRLRRRKDLQAVSEARARCVEQIEQAIDSHQYSRALELLEPAKQEFPGDADLSHLEQSARQGKARVAEAESLLAEAMKQRTEGRLQDAANLLQQAYKLDRSNPDVCEALQSALIEQARAVMDQDWRAAERFLNEAQDLGSGHFAVKGLLRMVADRRREEEVAEVLASARALQASGDVRGAYSLTSQKLKVFPQDLDIQQLHNRLKKAQESVRRQDLDSVQNLTAEAERSADPAFLKTILDRASESASRYPDDEEFSNARNRVRERLMTATVDVPVGETDVTVAAEEASVKRRPERKRPFKLPWQGGWRMSGGLDLLGKEKGLGIGAAFLLLMAAGIGLYAWGHRPKQLPPPPPAQLSKPTLVLNKFPAGASLVVNGKGIDFKEGHPVTLDTGKSDISITLPGYQLYHHEFPALAAGDKRSLDIQMSLLSPSIHLETMLNTGHVFLDDKSLADLQGGQYTLDTLPLGPRKLSVRGDEAFEFTFDAKEEGIVPSGLKTGPGGTLLLIGSTAGKMWVECNRQGLRLVLDNQDAGPCPTKASDISTVNVDTHKLEVLEGKQSLGTKNVTLGPATSLTAYLLSQTNLGTLIIKTNQDLFAVSVGTHEFERLGKGGEWRKSFLPGEMKVSVRKDGYTVEPTQITATIKKGVDLSQQFTFTPIPKTVTVTIKTESGADVNLGGAKATAGTDGVATLRRIPFGSLPVAITKTGFNAFRDTLQINVDPYTKAIPLQKQLARVEITAHPSGARIVVTNNDGTTNKDAINSVRADIPDGKYRLDITADGYHAYSDEIKLIAGETFTLNKDLLVKTETHPSEIVKDEHRKGWQRSENGWETISVPGSIVMDRGVPAEIRFMITRTPPGGFIGKLFNPSGNLGWGFQSTDRSRVLKCSLNDSGFHVEERIGKKVTTHKGVPPVSKKAEHSVTIKYIGGKLDTTIDNTERQVIDVDLAQYEGIQFTFNIDKNEVLSIKDYKYNPR